MRKAKRSKTLVESIDQNNEIQINKILEKISLLEKTIMDCHVSSRKMMNTIITSMVIIFILLFIISKNKKQFEKK